MFLAGSLPAIAELAGGSGIAAALSLALFAVALGVWVWAFAVAAARSGAGDNIAVGSLFLVEGSVASEVRRPLYWSFFASLLITAVAASSNPFAVLVPMLSLGLVGLWGARHGEFPLRRDVEGAARPLRPRRPVGQGGVRKRGTDG